MSLTVMMGDVPFEFDTSEWNALIGQHLQGAFDYETMSPAKRTVVKLGMKVLMRECLSQFEKASIRGQISTPPPDWDRADEDVLTYGASYVAAFLIAEIEKLKFIADYQEGENGAIRITGLHAAPALELADAPTLLQLAGPTSGPDGAEAEPSAATSQPPQSNGDRGESGGYVDAGGDEGDGQDVRGQAIGTRAVEALS